MSERPGHPGGVPRTRELACVPAPLTDGGAGVGGQGMLGRLSLGGAVSTCACARGCHPAPRVPSYYGRRCWKLVTAARPPAPAVSRGAESRPWTVQVILQNVLWPEEPRMQKLGSLLVAARPARPGPGRGQQQASPQTGSMGAPPSQEPSAPAASQLHLHPGKDRPSADLQAASVGLLSQPSSSLGTRKPPTWAWAPVSPRAL